MKLIVLSKPPIIIDHPKAVVIKTRYLNGEKLEKLQREYDFDVAVERDGIKIREK